MLEVWLAVGVSPLDLLRCLTFASKTVSTADLLLKVHWAETLERNRSSRARALVRGYRGYQEGQSWLL